MTAIAHGGGTHTSNAAPASTPAAVPAARRVARATVPSRRRRTTITTVTAIQYDLGWCHSTPIASAAARHTASRAVYSHRPGSARRPPGTCLCPDAGAGRAGTRRSASAAHAAPAAKAAPTASGSRTGPSPVAMTT
jgi:hypothetical protein